MTDPLRVSISPSRGITHLRQRNGVAHLSFKPPGPAGAPLSQIFGMLSSGKVNLFFIKKSIDEIGLGVDSPQGQEAARILRDAGVEARVEPECAVTCVVASNMKYVPGVMHRIVRALNAAGVKLLSTSDSFNSVSCLVPSGDIEAATRALGDEFRIEESPVPGPLDPW